MATLELPARRVESSRALVSGVPIAVLLITFLALHVTHTHPSAYAFTPALIAVLLAIGFRVWRRPRQSGTLRIDERGVSWNGEPVYARTQLRDAIAYTNGKTHGLCVKSRWRAAYFEVDSREAADVAVIALGKDSSQAAVNVAESVGAFAWIWFNFAQMLHLGHGLFGIVVSLAAMFSVPLMISYLSRTQWLMGSDGLLVKKGLRRGRFVPYSGIAEVTAAGAKVRVQLRGGSELSLRSVDDSKESARPVIGAGALAARIEAGRLLAQARVSGGDVAAVLARGGRDVGAWMRALRDLEEGSSGYRVAAVPRERLWNALEDPAQPLEVRAAAAAPLQPGLKDVDRTRLRVMAAACASPRLRVAIEAAGESDDGRLAVALEEVADDEAPAAGTPMRASS